MMRTNIIKKYIWVAKESIIDKYMVILCGKITEGKTLFDKFWWFNDHKNLLLFQQKDKSQKRNICRITDSGCKSGRQQQFFRIYISGVSIWHEKKTWKSKTDQLQRRYKFVNSPSRPLMSRSSLAKSIHPVS